MIQVTRRTDCRLCRGRDLDLVLRLAPAPIADAYIAAGQLEEVQETYPLDLFLCRGCGHAQLLHVVDPEILYGDYIYVTANSPGLLEHFRGYADEVHARIRPRTGALAVDVGSNDGILLRFFKEKGLSVLGVDPAREIAKRVTASGIETLPEFFTPALAHEIKTGHGHAAIVTANNVFANVDNLGELTDGIRDVLAPDGVFVFEVSYLGDLIQGMVFDFIYHEHLSYHSVSPLEKFLRQHGMELIEIRRVPTKGGSLRYTAQLAGGPRPVSPSVAECIATETRIGLGRPEVFKTFGERIEALKARLADVLRERKAGGRTIAGYGASATVTTLIYHFDLAEVLSFLIDDNPLKQNRFSPGRHIPVFPSHVLYERKPDDVLILAWRFAQPIIKKHQAYLDQGGRFIVPVPAIELIGPR